jgi:hypothetical protein
LRQGGSTGKKNEQAGEKKGEGHAGMAGVPERFFHGTVSFFRP